MATIEQKLAQAKEIKERDNRISQDFLELREEYPKENVSCIFETLALRYRALNKRMKRRLYPSTPMGVRGVLIRNKRYQPKSRTCKHGDSTVQ